MSIEPRVVELYAKETHVGTISAINADLFIVRFTSADVVNPNETVWFGKAICFRFRGLRRNKNEHAQRHFFSTLGFFLGHPQTLPADILRAVFVFPEIRTCSGYPTLRS